MAVSWAPCGTALGEGPEGEVGNVVETLLPIIQPERR